MLRQTARQQPTLCSFLKSGGCSFWDSAASYGCKSVAKGIDFLLNCILYQKEKELSDAKIDVRIAQREAKTAEDQLRGIQEEKQKWGEKLQAEIKVHSEQLQGERDKVDQLNQQVMSLSAELQDMKQKEQAARKQFDVSCVCKTTPAPYNS
jgi:flagellar biosynthesis chaperone FliJ